MFGRSRRVTSVLLVVTVLAILGVAALVVVPRVVLERAKAPGLGVRALHAQGVTGAGVHVAVIDGRLRRDHVAYAYLTGVLALALQVAPDLHASDLAGLLAEGAIHGPGLIAPARVVESARAQVPGVGPR